MNLEGQYEYYRCVQRDFNEAYKMVNDYVTDLYLLPKKFIDNTGPALDIYIKNYSFASSESRDNNSYQSVIDFISQLDDFTAGTMELFSEHKTHCDRSKAYLRKVLELNERNAGKIVSEYAVDYIELTPELRQLHNELKKIKEKADDMVDKLDRLELRWENIRVKVRA
ncbi:MAG TPA: hypothetical protein VG603_11790 [Chitinophagales bacterium]|nr:hypothetical protein [Chitinophagales bacterium]